MKIKIIKASDDKWYKHLVGKTRTARGIFGEEGDTDKSKDCYILRNYRTLLRTVNCDDAELISEK